MAGPLWETPIKKVAIIIYSIALVTPCSPTALLAILMIICHVYVIHPTQIMPTKHILADLYVWLMSSNSMQVPSTASPLACCPQPAGVAPALV